jgi:hypothetical protein
MYFQTSLNFVLVRVVTVNAGYFKFLLAITWDVFFKQWRSKRTIFLNRYRKLQWWSRDSLATLQGRDCGLSTGGYLNSIPGKAKNSPPQSVKTITGPTQPAIPWIRRGALFLLVKRPKRATAHSSLHNAEVLGFVQLHFHCIHTLMAQGTILP